MRRAFSVGQSECRCEYLVRLKIFYEAYLLVCVSEISGRVILEAGSRIDYHQKDPGNGNVSRIEGCPSYDRARVEVHSGGSADYQDDD